MVSKTTCAFLLFVFQVYQVTRADLRSCNSLVPPEGVPPIPTSEQLSAVCPGILAYIDCYGKEMEEHPDAFDEHNQLFHEHLGQLVKDVCNDTSRIHTDYINSIECFENVKDMFDPCLEKANSVYREYKVATGGNSDVEEESFSEKECLTRGHAVGCMTDEISKTCETLQLSTYIELVQRSRYLGKVCFPSTAELLRTDYLDYLKVDESVKAIYKLAFEYED